MKIEHNNGEDWYSTWVDFTTEERNFGFNAFNYEFLSDPLDQHGVYVFQHRLFTGDYQIDHPDWPALARTAPPEVLTDWLLENGPEPLRRQLEELLAEAGVGL